MKIGNILVIAAVGYILYELFIKKSGTVTTGDNIAANLGTPQFNEQGQRIPYFYALANYDGTAIFKLVNEATGEMQEMSSTLPKAAKVSVFDTLGQYYKIDCDGLYVKANSVTPLK
jgi:hypothetical protein